MAEKMIDRREAIENLQRYLREISHYDKNIPPVPIDGIYGNATRESVFLFQKRYGLKSDGAVDKVTWDTIYRVYKEYRSDYEKPLGIFPYPHMKPDFRIEKDEVSDLVMIIQIMLNTMKLGYDDLGDFKVNGVYDDDMIYAIKQFQRHNFLPQSGLVDANTWDKLAQNYNKYIKIN